MAETPKPLTQTASKPQLSIRRALIASCAPTATTGPGSASPSLNSRRLRSALFRWRSDDEFTMVQLLFQTFVLIRLDQLEDASTDALLGVDCHGTDVRGEDHVRKGG